MTEKDQADVVLSRKAVAQRYCLNNILKKIPGADAIIKASTASGKTGVSVDFAPDTPYFLRKKTAAPERSFGAAVFYLWRLVFVIIRI